MTKHIHTITTAFALALATLVGGTAMAAPASLELDRTEQGAALDGVVGDHAQFEAGVVLEGVVNLNTASADQLELLPGIGPAMAKKIISYRSEHPFKQRNNIMRIKGIGQKTFAKIKDHLAVEGETTLRVAG